MKRALLLALLAATALIAASPAGRLSPRAVFAKHDPNGRLPNTSIRKLGTIRVKSSIFDIYFLDFSNPVSLHGQQRISIIKNRRQFMGSFECSLWLGDFPRGPYDPAIRIGTDRFTVTIPAMPHDEFVVRFTERGPTRNKYFCGEGSGWEDGI